jgi:hypothetical protein
MKKTASFLCALTLVLSMPMSAFAVGAIAVDDDEGDADPGFGYVVGEKNRADAEAGALKECSKSGNKNCKIAVWFKQCGAYASSKKNSGIGYGDTKRVAEAKALDECGTKACKIVISDCE